MTDSDGPRQPDQVVPLPDGAQIFRVADEAGDGDGLIAPVALSAARSGDVVVLPDRRTGKYLGGGRVLLESGAA
ncbi:TRIM [Mycolicibacterium fortuitum subsp. acetamidolyticum]|uniref:TRIM n=1 Tax=Mycolicibacterium fortuitum subsp. acetamidolyticum TaxID=144550 RepID=A0A117IG92_MYCFO|nr:TRIM [Mycolicibacterium fortuitum subsp. acetamidolyticum]